MKKKEQREFIQELTTSIADELIRKIDDGKTPETWDGLELRQWLVDKTRELSIGNGDRSDLNAKRLREYRNTVIVNNL